MKCAHKHVITVYSKSILLTQYNQEIIQLSGTLHCERSGLRMRLGVAMTCHCR